MLVSSHLSARLSFAKSLLSSKTAAIARHADDEERNSLSLFSRSTNSSHSLRQSPISAPGSCNPRLVYSLSRVCSSLRKEAAPRAGLGAHVEPHEFLKASRDERGLPVDL